MFIAHRILASRHLGISLSAVCALALLASSVWAEDKAAINPGLVTAPKNQKILFEDAHIRFVEVTRWPGEKGNVDGVPYPAVIVADAAMPAVTDKALDAKAAQTAENRSVRSTPPSGKNYPWCETRAPQLPHAVTVTGDFPQHFYRVEYKRIDAAGYAANWKTWYPWMLEPLKPVKDLVPGPELGAPYSKEWPYPIALSALTAAPNNHYLRYEDDHIQLLEVVIRPGEKEAVHGHPYASVFADDTGESSSVGTEGGNIQLYPNLPDNKGPVVAAPKGLPGPQCNAADPEAPHQAFITKGPPAHFFRIHFKRVDGEDIKTKWREWYPQTAVAQ